MSRFSSRCRRSLDRTFLILDLAFRGGSFLIIGASAGAGAGAGFALVRGILVAARCGAMGRDIMGLHEAFVALVAVLRQ